MLLGKDNRNTIQVLTSKACFSKQCIKRISWNERRNKKFWNFCGTRYINMVHTSRKMYERNAIGTIPDNDGILSLNEKYIKEELDHKTLREIRITYHSDQRKHRYEQVEDPKKTVKKIFIDEKLTVKVIMDCTTLAHEFRTSLGFKQYDVILTKEQ